MAFNSIADVVNSFNTTPFLFVGSGLSVRYLGLPNWEGLLRYFSHRLSTDDFSFEFYRNEAHSIVGEKGLYPKIASLIERDFNRRWFSDEGFRAVSKEQAGPVVKGVSPFKLEVSAYINSHNQLKKDYAKEISLLTELSKKSISGAITTNYDCFLERVLGGFTKYIGQEELIFSSIQNIAEIYKIHGCTSDPRSIIINEEDYNKFSEKSSYLAAKLMTTFMEYPIIFIGYSIADANIQAILKSIINCLTEQNLQKLQDRFIFVDYKLEQRTPLISPHTFSIDDKTIGMTKITLSNFTPLFEGLSSVKRKIPVKIMRAFKQEFYDFTLTSTPSVKLRLANIEDDNLDESDLALVFGKMSDLGPTGLLGITVNEWHRDIIMNDIRASSEDLLGIAFPKLIRGNGGLPVFKHIQKCNNPPRPCLEYAEGINFESLLNNTIRKDRLRLLPHNRSIREILKLDSTLEKQTRLITYLLEDEIDIDDLYAYLSGLFTQNKKIIDDNPPSAPNIRKLIRIFDYLKYKK